MNIFKKMESFLEDVDQQASTQLNRPASASKYIFLYFHSCIISHFVMFLFLNSSFKI